jgi:hypothetical protein
MFENDFIADCLVSMGASGDHDDLLLVLNLLRVLVNHSEEVTKLLMSNKLLVLLSDALYRHYSNECTRAALSCLHRVARHSHNNVKAMFEPVPLPGLKGASPLTCLLSLFARHRRDVPDIPPDVGLSTDDVWTSLRLSGMKFLLALLSRRDVPKFHLPDLTQAVLDGVSDADDDFRWNCLYGTLLVAEHFYAHFHNWFRLGGAERLRLLLTSEPPSVRPAILKIFVQALRCGKTDRVIEASSIHELGLFADIDEATEEELLQYCRIFRYFFKYADSFDARKPNWIGLLNMLIDQGSYRTKFAALRAYLTVLERIEVPDVQDLLADFPELLRQCAEMLPSLEDGHEFIVWARVMRTLFQAYVSRGTADEAREMMDLEEVAEHLGRLAVEGREDVRNEARRLAAFFSEGRDDDEWGGQANSVE